MPTAPHPHTIGQRCAGLAALGLLGLMLLAVCWHGAAAQAQTFAPPAAPASGAIWFVNNMPGEGLVGYWKFDQVVNTSTVNSALLTNAATFSNGISLSSSTLPPLLGIPNFQKLALNGTNQFLLVPDAPQLDVAPDHFSIAAWVRRTTSGTSDLIYDSGSGTGHWYFGFLGSDNTLAFTLDSVVDIRSSHVVTDSQWHHVAAVINGTGPSNLSIYLDGAASAPLTVTVSAAPTGTKTIGIKNVRFNTPFAGDLDEVRLYNRALTAAEVLRLAQGRGCAHDGLTWATAFADLQCALDVASFGDEIWVAMSLEPYRPGTSVQASFNLVSRAGLFGNFRGNELSRDQRPPVNFDLDLVTRLSGDLLDDDARIGGTATDNARHVVAATNPDAGTVLDGVRVEAGNSSGSLGPTSEGGGLRDGGTGQLLVANALFINNFAGGAGGGLYAENSTSLDNVTFKENTTAEGGGGAVILSSGLITGGLFRSNSAAHCGGLGTEFGVLTATSTQFDFNHATNFGGGACTFGPATFSATTFLLNQAANSGGGLYTQDIVTLTAPQFLSNTTATAGGALDADSNQPVTVHGGLFAGNSATGTLSEGGAIFLRGALNLDGAQFVGNSADSGGALATLFFANRITNTVFLANRAVISDGGALRAHNGTTALTNVLLVGNQAAGQGGALFLDQSPGTLAQLTAVSNTATVSGSVVFANVSATHLFNSVVWHNGSAAIGQQGSAVNFEFNLGDTGISNTGNLSADPIFARAPNPGDGDWTTLADNDYGDLRLTGASPGIDAGNNTLLAASPATDLAGQPRFVDDPSAPDRGVGSPPVVDMGAYEFQLLKLFLPAIIR